MIVRINGLLATSVGEDRYIDEAGHVYKLPKDKVKRARNIPEPVKSAFHDIALNYSAKERATKRFKEEEKKYHDVVSEINAKQNRLLKELQYCQGKISMDEFIEVFYASLSDSMKQEMHTKGYEVDPPFGQSFNDDNNLYVSRHKSIQKYFRRASFLEEEYDGCVFILPDAEKYPEYKRFLKAHSAPLATKTRIKECLYMGDKDTLSYSACYEIPIKKTLTKEYAKELAAEFCK